MYNAISASFCHTYVQEMSLDLNWKMLRIGKGRESCSINVSDQSSSSQKGKPTDFLRTLTCKLSFLKFFFGTSMNKDQYEEIQFSLLFCFCLSWWTREKAIKARSCLLRSNSSFPQHVCLKVEGGLLNSGTYLGI